MATSDTVFSEQLRQRFAEVGLTPPAPGQQAYTLRFAGDITLNFIEAANRAVEVIAEAGTINDRNNAESLLALLACSPFGTAYPIALHCDKESGVVLLWTRAFLAQLDAAGFEQLVASMLTRAAAVRKALAGTSPAPAPERAVAQHRLGTRRVLGSVRG